MKTSRKWHLKSIAGTALMGLALAALIGSSSTSAAFAKDNHKGTGKYDNSRYENKKHGHDRRRHVQSRPAYRHYGQYGHRQRAYYPPPPVIYAPPPPPGIRIFFPPIFIHP